MNELNEIRESIDRLDGELVALLDSRTKLAAKLAKIKADSGVSVTDPNRENEVISNAKKYAKEPIVEEHIEELYHTVMRMAKVKQLSIATSHLPFRKIGIIGHGMMGGSIYKSIREADGKAAISFIDDAGDIPSSIDLLILAIPTSEVLKISPGIAELSSELVVMDIASVKKEIVEQFRQLSNGSVEFVATHPMAGSEKMGFKHSKAGLFVGCRWIISRHENNHPKTLSRIEKLIQILQADVIYLDGKAHDEKIGLVSHMARVLSSSLYAYALETDPMSLELAGSGFHSMTRLAKGNRDLLDEMLHFNRDNVLQHLDGMINHLEGVRDKVLENPKLHINNFQERVS